MTRSEFRFGLRDNPPRRAQVERVLTTLGWRPAKAAGAHVVWYSPDGQRTTLVSGHKGKDIPYGTFRSMLRGIGITEQAFYELL